MFDEIHFEMPFGVDNVVNKWGAYDRLRLEIWRDRDADSEGEKWVLVSPLKSVEPKELNGQEIISALTTLFIRHGKRQVIHDGSETR